MTDDDTPTLPETLHELDAITEDLDQVITNLYTWRDQHTEDQAVRDTLAGIGGMLSGAWAELMHARQRVSDLPASVRTAPPATTSTEAEAQADAALGSGRWRVRRRTDGAEWLVIDPDGQLRDSWEDQIGASFAAHALASRVSGDTPDWRQAVGYL